MTLKSKIFDASRSFLPPRWFSILLYTFSRNSRLSWGGPFNGQQGRTRIFLELLDLVQPKAIIETGTYRGTTTEFIAGSCPLPVFTLESDPHNYYYSQFRLRRFKNVRVLQGRSQELLTRMSRDPGIPGEAVLFYLDAHWGGELPAREELGIIISNWREFVVMIDDFQVPGDPGYGFEIYKNGSVQDLDYFGDLLSGLDVFFPALPSQTETGMKRGCVVLSTGRMTPLLRKAISLRLFVPGTHHATD
jgi:hypothetical protein